MENVVRFLMRFILVPLGYLAAGVAATAVVLMAWWPFADATSAGSPDLAVFGFVIAPFLLYVMLVFILLPASIGILISEAFAIRSWIFHVLNGVVSAYLGWQFFGGYAGIETPFEQPLAVAAAGIVAGFAYWAVAGFSAGFYRPIFRSNPPPPVPATTR